MTAAVRFAKVGITGGSGRLGRAVLARLEGACERLVIDRIPPAAAVAFKGLDVTDYAALKAAFAGCDAVIHLAAIPNPWHPALALVHLSDTPREVYRHSAVGQGSVPFAAVPPVLEEVGYRDLPMLEIIADDPDRSNRRQRPAAPRARLAAPTLRLRSGGPPTTRFLHSPR